MKAVTYHGKRDVRVDEVPDPTIEEPTDAIVRDHLERHLRIGPPSLRGARPVPRRRGHPRPRADGDRRGGWLRGHPHRPRRPGGDPVQRLLRPLLHVRSASVLPVRDHAGDRAGQGRVTARLHQAVRPGPGRPGGVPPGPAGPLRPDQGLPTARPTTGSSTCPTCCRRRGRQSSMPTSRRAAPSPCSASARSARCAAGSPCTVAPPGCSGSTWSPSGWSSPAGTGSSRSTSRATSRRRRNCASEPPAAGPTR